MKKHILLFATAFASLMTAQENQDNDAFRGKGDLRGQGGANFQKGGSGIQASLDYGLGESFSIGAVGGYVLGYKEVTGLDKPSADQRFDLKARASAHLGDVIGFPQNFDVYPGLDLGLKNFGAHLGARYFFGKGFGLFTEIQFPIARYSKNADNYKILNNQFNFAIGASFDISKK